VDREQLKATQAPLKARYRNDPARAFITLHADGTLGDEDVSCSSNRSGDGGGWIASCNGWRRRSGLLRRHAPSGAGCLCRSDVAIGRD
jgi:hypothetical protein